MWNQGVWGVTLAAGIAACAASVSRDAATSWYPLEPGTTRVYQKEALEGDMDHPSRERWNTEETIVGSAAVPEIGATLVTKRTRVLDDTLTAGYLAANDQAKRELPESHLLIYRNCVYILDGPDAEGSACDLNVGSKCLKPLSADNRLQPEYRGDLVHGKIPADFCFPMAVGRTWGKVPQTSPAMEYVWRVDRLNADPFGPPDARTYHLSQHLGAGDFEDRWLTEGVGLVQEVEEHHGTYDERRRQLVRATIHGRSLSFQLTPARTAPLSAADCTSPGWRHYSRADGSLFSTETDCAHYSRRR